LKQDAAQADTTCGRYPNRFWTTMEISLAILGAALGGGLLLLHGFGKSKAIGECMLEMYQGLLAKARPQDETGSADSDGAPDKRGRGSAA
jgi:hypothetical protein